MNTNKTAPNFLSNPSKMPCASLNIPAWRYCPAAKIMMNLAKKAKKALDNVICSSCYALKGFYQMPNVAQALQAKANFITDSIKQDGGDSFVKEMVRHNSPSITTQKAKRKSSRIAIRIFFVCMIREIYFLQSILIAGFVFARSCLIFDFGFLLVST